MLFFVKSLLYPKKQVYNAFPLVGFTEEETMDVWRIVAAILHLGNITFKEAGGESAEVANPDALAKVAELLAVAPQNLKDGFMTSKITVGSEVIFKQLNPEAVGCASQIKGRLSHTTDFLSLTLPFSLPCASTSVKPRAMQFPKLFTTACFAGWWRAWI